MKTNYPSSLTDAEWDCIQRFLPPRSPHGKLRRHCLRTVFDAIFYLLRTGCPWRYLPSDFPPWQTVYYHFRQFCRTGLWVHLWRGLREAERRRVGKDPHPSAAIMDAQSVKTVEESARISGFDAHKCVKGRKRQRYGGYLGAADHGLCDARRHARYTRCPSTPGRTEIRASPGSRKSGLTLPIVAKSWLTGVKHKVIGTSKS